MSPPIPSLPSVLIRLRMPVTCSLHLWRSFGRSRLGLPRWDISNSPSWILGQEVWENTPSSENLGQISLEPSSSQVSEDSLCAHPQSNHSSILLSNHPALVHKLSKGRNHASSVLAAWYRVLGQRRIVFIVRSRTRSLEHGWQIGPCGCGTLFFAYFGCVCKWVLFLDLKKFQEKLKNQSFIWNKPGFQKKKKMSANN